jgi:hypothetical protein
MANPGHALASSSLAQIQFLQTELNQLKAQHQIAMTHLAGALKEILGLLQSTGTITKNDVQSLSSINIFITMNHHQNMW